MSKKLTVEEQLKKAKAVVEALELKLFRQSPLKEGDYVMLNEDIPYLKKGVYIFSSREKDGNFIALMHNKALSYSADRFTKLTSKEAESYLLGKNKIQIGARVVHDGGTYNLERIEIFDASIHSSYSYSHFQKTNLPFLVAIFTASSRRETSVPLSECREIPKIGAMIPLQGLFQVLSSDTNYVTVKIPLDDVQKKS